MGRRLDQSRPLHVFSFRNIDCDANCCDVVLHNRMRELRMQDYSLCDIIGITGMPQIDITVLVYEYGVHVICNTCLVILPVLESDSVCVCVVWETSVGHQKKPNPPEPQNRFFLS